MTGKEPREHKGLVASIQEVQDASHAARVLKALVDEGNVHLGWGPALHGVYTTELLSCLVNNAKSTLKTFEGYDTDPIRDVWICACHFIEAQAKASIPHMIKLGMKVPK